MTSRPRRRARSQLSTDRSRYTDRTRSWGYHTRIFALRGNPRLCKTNLMCFREPTTLEYGSEQAPLRTPACMTRTRGCTCLSCTRSQARCPRRQLRNGFRILRVVNVGSGSCHRWLMQPRADRLLAAFHALAAVECDADRAGEAESLCRALHHAGGAPLTFSAALSSVPVTTRATHRRTPRQRCWNCMEVRLWQRMRRPSGPLLLCTGPPHGPSRHRRSRRARRRARVPPGPPRHGRADARGDAGISCAPTSPGALPACPAPTPPSPVRSTSGSLG